MNSTIRSVAAAGILLAACMLPGTLCAQDPTFEDLARRETPAVAKIGTAPVSEKDLTEGDKDLLKVLLKAISTAREGILERTKDSNGRSIHDPAYAVYEQRKTDGGHLLMSGTLLRNKFKGYANKKNPIHDFSIDPAAAKALQEADVYLETVARHASSAHLLVAVYRQIVFDLVRYHAKGPEAEWFKIPLAAAQAVRQSVMALEALRDVVTVVAVSNRFGPAPRDVTANLEGLLSLNRTAFGVDSTRGFVDSARAFSAFERTVKGSNPVVGKTKHGYRLKSDLRGQMEKIASPGLDSSGPTASLGDRLRRVAWLSASRILDTIEVDPGFSLDGRAEDGIARRVLEGHTKIEQMIRILDNLDVRTK